MHILRQRDERLVQKMSKYHNQKVTADGHTFDSKKEYRRYCELKLLERAGVISDLELQKPFVLIPAQYEVKADKPAKSSKTLLERAVTYKADFVYTQDGKTVVEDVKGGVRTKEYILKRKLMLYLHGIRIKEV